jgi:hypothetical protein
LSAVGPEQLWVGSAFKLDLVAVAKQADCARPEKPLQPDSLFQHAEDAQLFSGELNPDSLERNLRPQLELHDLQPSGVDAAEAKPLPERSGTPELQVLDDGERVKIAHEHDRHLGWQNLPDES